MKLGRILLCIFILVLFFTNCAGKGIEVGNPNSSPVNKQVVITPATGNVNYVTRFTSDIAALVSRVEKKSNSSALVRQQTISPGATNIVDTINVIYGQSSNVISFQAGFVDGTEILVSLNIDANGNITTGTVTINGITVNASISVSGGTNPANALAAINAGINFFRNRNVVAARNSFCNEFINQPANAQLAFGCFWAKMMLIPELPESAALLATVDESPFNLDASLLGSNGLFVNRNQIRFGDSPPDCPTCAYYTKVPFFNYTEFNLPFASFMSQNTLLSATEQTAILVTRAVNNNIEVSDLQNMIDDLLPHFRELELLLAVSLADQSFSFNLPGGLFRLPADVTVTYTDTLLFMGSTQMSIVAMDLANAYESGIELNKIVFNGDIDQALLVEDLNGSGATINGITVDQVAFGTLIDANRVRNSQSRFTSGLQFLRTGLRNINNGQPSRFVDRVASDYDLQTAVLKLNDLIAATNGAHPMSLGSHALTLNLRQFFLNPPDAASLSVSAGDPFVLQNGSAAFVENYFHQYLQGRAIF